MRYEVCQAKDHKRVVALQEQLHADDVASTVVRMLLCITRGGRRTASASAAPGALMRARNIVCAHNPTRMILEILLEL